MYVFGTFDSGFVIKSANLLSFVKTNPKTCWVEIEIVEGKNRQIRRMFEKLGYKVENLVRVKIGNFEDKNLKPGEWRFLSKEELKQIAPGYFK